MKFFTKKTFTESKPLQKHNRIMLSLKLAIGFTIIAWSVYGIVTFINTHDFRSPILFQNPIPLKVQELKIISPLASPSATVVPVVKKTVKQVIVEETTKAFGKVHVEAMNTLIFKESSFNPMAMNKTSGACGLFQFYPCSKLISKCPDMEVGCQVKEGITYIKNRYTNPTGALAFHLEKGWY